VEAQKALAQNKPSLEVSKVLEEHNRAKYSENMAKARAQAGLALQAKKAKRSITLENRS